MSELDESGDILEVAKVQLNEIDSLPISEHAQRLEGVHRKLESALSTIDGL